MRPGYQEHKCHWRAYGQPDGTVVCDECNTAADVNKLIDSAKREVLEQIRPPQATIDSMKLTQPHKYRGVEYPCCSICGFCPEAINAFIDSQLEQSEESK